MTKLSFTDWMAKVDAIIIAKTGLSSDDLPDLLYDNEYEDEATPLEAAKAAIAAAKEF